MLVCVLLAAVVVPTVCLKVLLQVVTEQKEREWQPRDGQSTTESKLNGWGATSQRFQRPSNPSHRNLRAADFSRKVLFSSPLKRQSSEKKTAMTTTRSLSAPMGTRALTSPASLSEACDLRGSIQAQIRAPTPALRCVPCCSWLALWFSTRILGQACDLSFAWRLQSVRWTLSLTKLWQGLCLYWGSPPAPSSGLQMSLHMTLSQSHCSW